MQKRRGEAESRNVENGQSKENMRHARACARGHPPPPAARRPQAQCLATGKTDHRQSLAVLPRRPQDIANDRDPNQDAICGPTPAPMSQPRETAPPRSGASRALQLRAARSAGHRHVRGRLAASHRHRPSFVAAAHDPARHALADLRAGAAAAAPSQRVPGDAGPTRAARHGALDAEAGTAAGEAHLADLSAQDGRSARHCPKDEIRLAPRRAARAHAPQSAPPKTATCSIEWRPQWKWPCPHV